MQIINFPSLPSTQSQDLSSSASVKGYLSRLLSALDTILRQILKTINRGIEFNNLLAYHVTISDTGLADTEITVTHSLGFVPSRYVVTQRSKACIVYDGSTPWTTEAIYIKCNAANAAVTISVLR